MKSLLLTLDAIINLILGIPLMFAPHSVPAFLGLPMPSSGFYPSILGAILTGIGIALLVNALTTHSNATGLGLAGAICINLSGSAVLLSWLLFGGLEIPLRGRLFLWVVVLLVMILSAVELGRILKTKKLEPPLPKENQLS